MERVVLRELWKHEERGFSAWLETNLDMLSEAIGVSLSDPQREQLVGSFQVDLVAENENGERVIVENQLEATDHDHLGKLLTYLTNLDAKAAIWITSAPRPEHIRAIQWLNETTPNDVAFYLVRLAAYRISGSDAAPLFTVIVGPSAESKSFGKQKKELAERHVLRLRFWEQLSQRKGGSLPRPAFPIERLLAFSRRRRPGRCQLHVRHLDDGRSSRRALHRHW